jgi:hypothetical protein
VVVVATTFDAFAFEHVSKIGQMAIHAPSDDVAAELYDDV